MNREDVAMDVTVQNVEILRGRLERAELAVRAIAQMPTPEQDNMISANMRHVAMAFLASQQGEQATAAENSQVHPEQVEGAQGELDDRMRAAGMFTVAEMLKGTPLDAFTKHAGVCDMETFGQWLEMKRAEYLKMQARYDLGERDKSDDLYEWVIAHLAVFTEAHVNFRAALAQPSPVRYCHNAGSTAVNPGAPLPGCVGAQPYPPPELDDEYVPAGIVQAAIKDSQVDAVGLAAAALAPELEWPELVARLYTDINGDIHASVHATAGEPLIRLSDFDRIIGALREEASGWKAMSIVAANGKDELRHKLEAAQARVAELEACGAPALLAAADHFAERAKGPSPGWVTLSAVAKELRVRADKAPVAQAGKVPDECPHLILFDDTDVKPIMFAGSGARRAALAKWEQVSVNWNAHLFVRIEKNCRDDRYPCATLAAAPAQGE